MQNSITEKALKKRKEALETKRDFIISIEIWILNKRKRTSKATKFCQMGHRGTKKSKLKAMERQRKKLERKRKKKGLKQI